MGITMRTTGFEPHWILWALSIAAIDRRPVPASPLCSLLGRKQRWIGTHVHTHTHHPCLLSHPNTTLPSQVVDRVLANVGGHQWWTAITGRFKAQRTYNVAVRDGANLKAFRDLSNYALCARTRVQLGSRFTLNGVIEAPDALILRNAIQHRTPDTNANGHVVSHRIEDGFAAHAMLKASLPGHDLSAVVGHNMDYVESSGDYARVPLAIALDLSSLDRADGLQYRVGLHQVTAPPTEYLHADPAPTSTSTNATTTATNTTSVKQGRPPQQPHQHPQQQQQSPPRHRPNRTVLHAQGAVAVEGEAFIWRRGGGSGKNGTLPTTSTSTSTTSTPYQPPTPTPPPPAPSDATLSPTPAPTPVPVPTPAEDQRQAMQPGTSTKLVAQDPSSSPPSSTSSSTLQQGGRVSEALATAAAADQGSLHREGQGLGVTIQQGVPGSVAGRKATRNKASGGSSDGAKQQENEVDHEEEDEEKRVGANKSILQAGLESFMSPLNDVLQSVGSSGGPSDPDHLLDTHDTTTTTTTGLSAMRVPLHSPPRVIPVT